MKISFKLLIIMLICFWLINNALAENSSDVRSIREIFEKNYKIVFIENDTQKYNLSVDYSVEILKKVPNSLEAVYTIKLLNMIIGPENNEYLNLKFKHLYDKCYHNLYNQKDNLVEKLIFAAMLYQGMGFANSTTAELENNFKIGLKILTNIKDDLNSEYAPLACLLLGFTKPKIGILYYKEFKKKFKNHIFSQFIDFYIADIEYSSINIDYLKGIEIINELIPENNIITPMGYKAKIEYYDAIIECYINLKNYEKAKQYLEKIKLEASDYWRIKIIEKEINNPIPDISAE